MEVKLYSTNCPKCKVLERKLEDKSISYTVEGSTDVMLEKGIMSLPQLEINGELMDFTKAIEWVNKEG